MQGLPAYGAGLAYRGFYLPELLEHGDSIDFLEVPTEDYIVRPRRIMNDPTGEILEEVMKVFPCVAHGISLSIGSVQPLATETLADSRKFMDETGMVEFSEHLTYHRMDDRDLTVFMSMPFEEAAARWCANQYNQGRELIGQPYGLEVVAYSFPVDGSPMKEVEFVNRVCELTDCWLLLDVANLFINGENHGYDPIEFLDNLNGDRVQMLHVAGGHFQDGEWLDSHSQPVQEEVFQLLDETLKRTAARAIILERDALPEGMGSVLDDIQRSKEIFLKHRPAEAPESVMDYVKNPWPVKEVVPPLDLAALPGDIAAMQAYQKALVDCAFEMADGKHANESAEQIIARFPISDEWKARWQQMDWKQMTKLSSKLSRIIEDDKQMARRYQMAELAQFTYGFGPKEMIGR